MIESSVVGFMIYLNILHNSFLIFFYSVDLIKLSWLDQNALMLIYNSTKTFLTLLDDNCNFAKFPESLNYFQHARSNWERKEVQLTRSTADC